VVRNRRGGVFQRTRLWLENIQEAKTAVENLARFAGVRHLRQHRHRKMSGSAAPLAERSAQRWREWFICAGKTSGGGDLPEQPTENSVPRRADTIGAKRSLDAAADLR